MLQPTSCGPGPPDKRDEFRRIPNEIQDKLKKQAAVKRKIKEFKLKQQKLYCKNNKNNYNNNNNNDHNMNENIKKHDNIDDDEVFKVNFVNEYYVGEESIEKNLLKNNSNNNYNCHLENIKFHSKKVTAILTTPTATTTAVAAAQGTALTRVTKKNTNVQHEISNIARSNATATGTAAANTTLKAAATATALTTVEAKEKKSDVEQPTPKNSIKFQTLTATTVANVANNLNKFYKFLTIKTTKTITKTTLNSASIAATTTTAAASSTSTSTSIKWFLMFLMLFNILAQTPHQVAAEKSKHYYMQSLCKNHFLQQLYRKIDGAVLWSQNERNLDCIITFQTHSILQRFMLRFDMLQLDCNDHLYVYDGAHAVATPKIDISCRQTKQTVSSILTRTNFVTLKYVTDNWGTDANGFKLVITSVKDPKHTCKDFTCGSNGFCIHPDLLCDGINHCSDNSDESVHNLCQSETTSTVFGMDMTWFVMIVVSILLIISAAIVGITICVCRRQEETNNQQNTAIQLHHNLAETNGSSKHLHYTHGGTLTREHTQLPPTSGNWHHPAGPYTGYHRMQRNYLKMATKVRPILCLANFVN